MRIYNTLSKSLEEIVPLNDKKINIYVCGITPYDTTHLGHAFTYLSFDVLIRYLKYKRFEINYSQNVTDINDRDNDILKRAKEQNTTWDKLSEYWTKKFLNDMQFLNWLVPNNYLFASENIPEMIKIINNLLSNNHAYLVNGNVYLDINTINNYSVLSGLNENEMLKIADDFEEDTKNPNKKHPLDITLWRAALESDSKHIPSFESPFGMGRPGWHLECSAMSICSLGEQIDIHGGGRDLIYPHHSAEIAQSEGSTKKSPFAKYWVHTGQISYQGEKMSKSLGNLVLVSDLAKKYSSNQIRFLLLSHHYHKDWEYFESELESVSEKVNEIEMSFKNNLSSKPELMDIFFEYMDDDNNSSKVLEMVYENKEFKEAKDILEILGFKF